MFLGISHFTGECAISDTTSVVFGMIAISPATCVKVPDIINNSAKITYLLVEYDQICSTLHFVENFLGCNHCRNIKIRVFLYFLNIWTFVGLADYY